LIGRCDPGDPGGGGGLTGDAGVSLRRALQLFKVQCAAGWQSHGQTPQLVVLLLSYRRVVYAARESRESRVLSSVSKSVLSCSVAGESESWR